MDPKYLLTLYLVTNMSKKLEGFTEKMFEGYRGYYYDWNAECKKSIGKICFIFSQATEYNAEDIEPSKLEEDISYLKQLSEKLGFKQLNPFFSALSKAISDIVAKYNNTGNYTEKMPYRELVTKINSWIEKGEIDPPDDEEVKECLADQTAPKQEEQISVNQSQLKAEEKLYVNEEVSDTGESKRDDQTAPKQEWSDVKMDPKYLLTLYLVTNMSEKLEGFMHKMFEGYRGYSYGGNSKWTKCIRTMSFISFYDTEHNAKDIEPPKLEEDISLNYSRQYKRI